MTDKILLQTKCTNCGYRNYPQWQEIPKQTLLTEIHCINCECKTLVLDDMIGLCEPTK